MPPLQGYIYVATQLHGFTSVCMAVWLRGLVDGYVPTCYWIQTLLVTLCVTES